ncbi:hypothetical protein [Bradyrhizobium sp. Tv2a-2]|uniref:hypothetical protein n=1 Tax=Bradyrhizobium sp. Tv2a-2 TaxID=113395 RepID=UPI00040F0DDF|nr:hypothetical protein [Bradyrhizobium sp. Tv2a-2]
MNTYEKRTAMLVQTATPNAGRMARAKAIAFEAAQALSGTAREGLMAYAMTGSAVAGIVIIAAPHLEVLLRCIFHGRG